MSWESIGINKGPWRIKSDSLAPPRLPDPDGNPVELFLRLSRSWVGQGIEAFRFLLTSPREHLISSRLTGKGMLVLTGASNGGLLCAMCANMAPEGTIGCCLIDVPTIDMLQFHKFTSGK